MTTHELVGADEETEDRVAGDELLYYRVLQGRTPPHYQRGAGPLVLAQAFSQRPEEEPFAGRYRLSIDRARLRGFNPDLTRRADPQLDPAAVGVVCLLAGEVRAIPGVADIIPDPIQDEPDLPDNPAHALICVTYDAAQPRKARERDFRVVRVGLADLANSRRWAVELPHD